MLSTYDFHDSPRPIGECYYTWRNQDGTITSETVAMEGSTGRFAHPGNAKDDATAFALDLGHAGRRVPKVLWIVEHQDRIVADLNLEA